MEQENKTEKPTPKKRKDERKKGHVAKTQELNSALILLASFILFSALGGRIIQNLLQFMTKTFNQAPTEVLSMGYMNVMAGEAFTTYLVNVGPFLLSSAVIGVLASVAQVKFVVSFEHIKQAGSKMNPISGMKRFFNLESFISLAKNILKAVIISYLLYKLIEGNLHEIFLLTGRDAHYVAERILNLVFVLGSRVAMVLLVIAVFDYIFQRKRYENKIMMTKHEMKMEHKHQEGDPMFKSKRKSKHAELSRLRMMKDVPEADVVVTNPTMYAVAIQYRAEFEAPKVVAKGLRLVAQKIKTIALENEVPVVENVFVAQTVYKSCEVGQEIPPNLYKAVAEILAYVYQNREDFDKAGIL